MLAEKRQLEGQLLRPAGEVALAERELSGSRRGSPMPSADGGTVEAYIGSAAALERPRLLGYRTPLPEEGDEAGSDDSDFDEVIPAGIGFAQAALFVVVSCSMGSETQRNRVVGP